jgi:peptide/nickel transport system permease protein
MSVLDQPGQPATAAEAAGAAGTAPAAPAGRARAALRALRHNPSLLAGLILLLFVLAITVIVPLLSPGAATTIHSQDSLAGPGAGHLLGSDELGRDLLVRVADGYRISLAVAVGSVALALIIGVPLGLLAATSTRFVDGVVMRVMDILMAFPVMLLAIVVVALAGTGTTVLLLAIGVAYVPVLARVMRAEALETSKESFVEAARARGASYWRLMVRHIAVNSMGPVIVQATILVAVSIILEAGLSFVGLGVQPPTPSLGLMLSDGRGFMTTSSWVVVDPGVAILLAVLAFTLIGDGLQDWLDPKRRAIGR